MQISKHTVEYWYHERFPEKVRSRGRYLPRELRIRLYKAVLELRRRGMGYKRIRKRIEELYGVKLSLAVISDWCRGLHTPFGGTHIPTIDHLKPSPELAYVIGVVSGDGTATRKGPYNSCRVALHAKDREFVEEFAKSIGQVLNRDPPRLTQVRGGMFSASAGSAVLYKLLKKPINIDKIRPYVEHCNDCVRSFLRGFFDSEGSASVFYSRGPAHGPYLTFECYNSDLRLIKYVKKLLSRLGIETRGPRIRMRKGTTTFFKSEGRASKTKKDVYHIRLRAKSALRYYKLVGFTIARKQQKLEQYLASRGLLPNLPKPSSTLPSIPTFYYRPR